MTSSLYSKYRYGVYPYISDVRGAWRISRELRELASKGIPEVQSGSATSIFDYSWHNMAIFDACRYDLWEETFGKTESRITLGSNTREFIEETFASTELSDVVMVTANPQYADYRLEDRIGDPNPFHTKYDLYDTDWNRDLGTVRPEKVTQKMLTANRLFPDKRIIGHYLQPHCPFVSEEAEYDGFGVSKQNDTVWNRAERGEISQERAWNGYKHNLELLKDAVDALKNLEGKTLVTSDHGNFVGENKLYGHPGGMKHRPLREVPITRVQ